MKKPKPAPAPEVVIVRDPHKTVSLTKEGHDELKTLRQILTHGGVSILPEKFQAYAEEHMTGQAFTHGLTMDLACKIAKDVLTRNGADDE